MKNKVVRILKILLVVILIGLIAASVIVRIQSGAADGLYETFFALVPPIVAISLALLTREVYSSLFIGVVLAGLFASGFEPVGALDTLLNDGDVIDIFPPAIMG